MATAIKVVAPKNPGSKKDKFDATVKQATIFRGIMLGLMFLSLLFTLVLPSTKINVSVTDIETEEELWSDSYSVSPLQSFTYFIKGMTALVNEATADDDEILKKLSDGQTTMDDIMNEYRGSKVQRAEYVCDAVAQIASQNNYRNSKVPSGTPEELIKEANTLFVREAAKTIELFVQDIEFGQDGVVLVNNFVRSVQLDPTMTVEDAQKLADDFLFGEYEITEEFLETVKEDCTSELFVKTDKNSSFNKTGSGIQLAVIGALAQMFISIIPIIALITCIFAYIKIVTGKVNSLLTTRNVFLTLAPAVLGVIIAIINANSLPDPDSTYVNSSLAFVSVASIFAFIFGIGGIVVETIFNKKIKVLNEELQKEATAEKAQKAEAKASAQTEDAHEADADTASDGSNDDDDQSSSRFGKFGKN